MRNFDVLVVAYARKSNVHRLVQQCELNGIKRIYVAIDGPKTDEILAIQNDMETFLRDIQTRSQAEILIWRRERNLGSGAAVISGIDWSMKTSNNICILEDDLWIENNFFDFMQFGLEYISKNEKFLMVTGTNPFSNNQENRLYKVNYPVSWGWATNHHKWLQIRKNIFQDKIELTKKNIAKSMYWRLGNERALKGMIEAWDIPLAASMQQNSYYTLLPPINLVSNLGFDEYAAHTEEEVWPMGLKIGKIIDHPNYEDNPIDISALFEKRIYKIRKSVIVSYLVKKVVDKIRFKGARTELLEKVLQEDLPK